jgi:hypothetical protein
MMLGEWGRGHGRDFDVLMLPIGALVVMFILAIVQGHFIG